jgi:hypothetical protein
LALPNCRINQNEKGYIMAIGPLGNVIFINQNMHVAASKQTDMLNRYEIQNFHAALTANEKDEVIQEVRPTEETHHIDPDREHQKDQEEQKNKKSKELKQKEDKINDQTTRSTLHLLDITV